MYNRIEYGKEDSYSIQAVPNYADLQREQEEVDRPIYTPIQYCLRLEFDLPQEHNQPIISLCINL